MTKFKSKKDWKVGLFIWGSIAALALLAIATLLNEAPANRIELALGLLLFSLPVALLLWIWFDTGYAIANGTLIYRSGPFRGSISTKSIYQIIKKSRPLLGLKPVLSADSIKIIYQIRKKNKEIHLSPLDKSGFINMICKENRSVKIMN